MNMNPLTYEQISALTGLRWRTIRKHINAGNLGYRPAPRSIYVTRADVDKFNERRASGEIRGPGKPRKGEK